MNWFLLCRMLGLLGVLVGGAMVFSLPWAFPACGQTDRFEASGFWGLLSAIGFSLAIGGVLIRIGRRDPGPILRKEALAIVGLGWLLAGSLGALPFLFSGTQRHEVTRDGERLVIDIGVADALFESISGFTTTGASVLTDLEVPADGSPPLVPRCILFWRSFTHWLGGMGIIVLFVAILRQLGEGGKALLQREVPGPLSGTVRPRVREAAMVMWGIYVVISLLLTLLLMVEGMNLFESLCHTFGTMATGGFSTRNGSIHSFSSPMIEWTLVLFMILAGTNFSLYFLALPRKRPRSGITDPDTRLPAGTGEENVPPTRIRKWLSQRRPDVRPFLVDPEFRVYLALLITAVLFVSVSIYVNKHEANPLTAFRVAAFQSVSIMTTTGFATRNFDVWSDFSRGLLLVLMFVGGCAGSTGGGLKVVRFILFAKIVRLEIEQAFRPNIVRPLRLAGRPVDKAQRHQVMVYFCLVLLVFSFSWMLLLVIEPGATWQSPNSNRLVDTASAVAATLNNIGPGLGLFGPQQNYAILAPQSKILLAILMLLGRLELFAILVLFVPSFWRSR